MRSDPGGVIATPCSDLGGGGTADDRKHSALYPGLIALLIKRNITA